MNTPALPPGFEEDPPPPPGFELDAGGAPAPAAPPRPVGFLESALRTAGTVAQRVVGMVDMAAAGLANKLGGEEEGNRMFSAYQQRQARMSEAYAPKSDEQFSTAGSVAGGVLSAPMALLGQGAAPGVERAAQVVERGGTMGQAAGAGLTSAAVNQALQMVPIAAGGRVAAGIGGGAFRQAAGGAATGAGLAAATGVAGRAAENAALPEGSEFADLQQKVAPSAAEVGTGAALGALGMGGSQLAKTRRVERAARLEKEAAKKAALEAPIQEGREAAREAGYVLTPNQAGGGTVSRGAAGLAGEPRLEKLASLKNAEKADAAIRRDVGLPEDVPLSREALASKRAEAGAAYEDIKRVGDIQNDAQYMADLDKIVEGFDTSSKSFPHRSENPFQKTLDGLKQETVSAASAIEEVKLLRNDADKAYRTGDKALGRAYRSAADAVDNSIDRHLTRLAADQNPELAGAVQRYREARQLIAKTYLADKAINSTTGHIDASVYAAALDKKVPLSGEALALAKAAKQFKKSFQQPDKVGNTGATIHDVGMGLLGKTAALVPLRPLAREALLTEAVQNRMVPKRKPQVAPPEPPLTAEQSPFPPQGGPDAPPSPLGDLTPDWETAPGAAAPAGRQEVVPTEGLVPAIDEAGGPARVRPGGADLRQGSNESKAGPVVPGPVAEPPAPARRAGEQIPAVPGRPDLPDAMVGGPPKEVGATEPTGRAMQGALQTIDEFEARNPDKIPVGEATEIGPSDPRLAEIEQLRQTAKSDTVKKALAAEAAKLKRELKAQAEAEKLKADVAELRQAAAGIKDPKLRERLLARADELEKPEKIPVGEVVEGQPEIKAEKVGKIPVGKATEVPDEPATGRAPELEKLPTGEATHVTDSGVEEAIPAGEAKELFTPPGKGEAKAPEAEVRLEKGPRGQIEGFDKKGDPYQVKVSEQMLGADKKEKAILVEVHDPVTGQRRGFVDFAIRPDGVLVAENVKVAPYLKKRGLAELMYRAARDAKYDIAPGRVQTDEGLAMVEALQRKGVINKEAEGPRAKASDLAAEKPAPATETPAAPKALPEGVTLRPVKSGGFEAVNKQGNRIGRVTPTGEVTVDNAYAGKGIVQALRDAMKKPKP